MLETLSMHLRTTASPELQAAIEEACDHFEFFEMPEWQDRYTELLFTLDNQDIGDVVSAITTLTQNLQHVLLLNFQIQVQEETVVSRMNAVLQTLRLIDSTQEVDRVITICMEEGDPVEGFSALAELITAEPAELYHECLKDVGSALIQRILEVTRQRVPAETEAEFIDIQRDKEAIAKLKGFVKAMEVESVGVYNLIRDEGMKLHLPFQDYYDRLINILTPTKPRQMAIELYAMALISDITAEQIRPVIAKSLEATFSSLDIITPLTVELDAVILENQAKQTSGTREIK